MVISKKTLGLDLLYVFTRHRNKIGVVRNCGHFGPVETYVDALLDLSGFSYRWTVRSQTSRLENGGDSRRCSPKNKRGSHHHTSKGLQCIPTSHSHVVQIGEIGLKRNRILILKSIVVLSRAVAVSSRSRSGWRRSCFGFYLDHHRSVVWRPGTRRPGDAPHSTSKPTSCSYFTRT